MAKNQYKPKRTNGLGFIPPTLRHQHLIRLPFIKPGHADKKAPPAEGAGALEEGAAAQGGGESQVGESQVEVG